MLKNGQTYFKDLAVFIPQDFLSMFDHFSTSYMKELTLREFISTFLNNLTQ